VQILIEPQGFGRSDEMQRYRPYGELRQQSSRAGGMGGSWREGYRSWFSSCVRSDFLKPSIGRDMLL